jgi:predicted esterase
MRHTGDWLRSSGASVTLEIFADRRHEVCDEEIEQARRLLLALMTPRR